VLDIEQYGFGTEAGFDSDDSVVWLAWLTSGAQHEFNAY